jgi:hypothetical protein
MKYIISENKLTNFLNTYIDESVGRLRKFPINHVNARDDDFELVDDRGQTIFTYLDYHLAVEKDFFYKLMSLFSLEKRDTEKLIEKWFSSHYPDSMVIAAYPEIE